MPIRNLNKLFYPRSVAVIGANNAGGDPGHVVMNNLLRGGFEGPIMPVSADKQAIAGVLAYRDVGALPITPDLAVLAIEQARVPATLYELGERGTRAAIVLGPGPLKTGGTGDRDLHAAVRDTARPFGMRVLGPNCLGLMVPHIGLNASGAHRPADTGGVAFVSQSAAICTAVLDWVGRRDIGFSHFVSLGEAADVDFADILDYLGSDPMTRAILLFVESIHHGRAFMSAARGASRNKPVLVIKAGRVPQGQFLAAQRSHAPIGDDAVFDAAIRRAGMLRVFSFGELFAAVETLAKAKPLKGDRLAILANGYGMAIMAADTLLTKDGRLAELSAETIAKLDQVLPNAGPRCNPLSVSTDAPPVSYADAARILLAAPEVDAVMVLHVPTALASSSEAARGVIQVAKETRGAVLTSWMGGDTVEPARRLFAQARVPTYDTPTQAIDAFLHMVRFRRNQDILMQTPPSTPPEFTPARDTGRRIVAEALAAGRPDLGEAGALALLAAYQIPIVATHQVETVEAAVALATDLGFPVTLRLGPADPAVTAEEATGSLLDRPAAVRSAAEWLIAAWRQDFPGQPVPPLTVTKVPVRPKSRQVRMSIELDPVFGPIVSFGEGGATAGLIGERVAALPPLNVPLARELVGRSSVAAALGGSDRVRPADIESLCLTLVKLAQMAVDIRELTFLEINPMLVDEHGVLAVDVRVRATPSPDRHLAIRPYPQELEETFALRNGREVLLRPIRPEDEPAHYEFLSKVSLDDIRFRFFGLVRRLPHSEMARLTQIDYDREMAFVATADKEDGQGRETLGVVRTVTDPNNEQAEYAILVRSDLKGQRLGWKLMDKMLAYCRSRGTREMVGQVLRDNMAMLDLLHGLGFRIRAVPDEDFVEVSCPLQAAGRPEDAMPAAETVQT